MSEAEGTTVCPRLSKNRRKRSRISADLTAASSPVRFRVGRVESQRVAQLRLPLGGVMLHLGPPHADPVAHATRLTGDALRGPLVRRLGHPAYEKHACRRAEGDVEQPPHPDDPAGLLRALRRAAFCTFASAFIRFLKSCSRRSFIARRTP